MRFNLRLTSFVNKVSSKEKLVSSRPFFPCILNSPTRKQLNNAETITKPLPLPRNSYDPNVFHLYVTPFSRIFIISVEHRDQCTTTKCAIFLARREELEIGRRLVKKGKKRERKRGKNNAYDNSELDNESRERSELIYLLIREPPRSFLRVSSSSFGFSHSPASTVPRSGTTM